MKIQLDKCEFLNTDVEFLGFSILDSEIKTNPKRVEAMKHFPVPNTLQNLRSFLG